MDDLKTAAQNGDLNLLYYLIFNDPSLLDHIDEVPFFDTPLHIAAQHGNVEFAIEIMNLKPSFARKLNQNLYSPMHLALYNKQIDMVHLFLECEALDHLVRIRGKRGETPLHYLAAKENDVDHQQQKIHLLLKFLSVCPLSIQDTNNRKETAFHIAVKSENDDAFDFLLGRLRRACHKGSEMDERKIINLKDANGDNVLHIATAMNHSQLMDLTVS
nr:ankyrin repeat-containing protein BDA1-like isoform X2 [Ziziphus jujuba var. spinosa]